MYGEEPPRVRWLRMVGRVVGLLLVSLGVLVLLFAAYAIWGDTAVVNAHQDQMTRQLEQQWAREPSAPLVGPDSGPSPVPTTPRSAPPAGTGIAVMSIPKLNKRWAVVEGVTTQSLRYHPGHYPGTAMPGDEGNFAVAGHRTLALFFNLDRLAPGDEIIVETGTGRYVYRVTNVVIVSPTAVEVVQPVPPGEHAGQLLTLTTCNPKFNNYQRLIVHAALDG